MVAACPSEALFDALHWSPSQIGALMKLPVAILLARLQIEALRRRIERGATAGAGLVWHRISLAIRCEHNKNNSLPAKSYRSRSLGINSTKLQGW